MKNVLAFLLAFVLYAGSVPGKKKRPAPPPKEKSPCVCVCTYDAATDVFTCIITCP